MDCTTVALCGGFRRRLVFADWFVYWKERAFGTMSETVKESEKRKKETNAYTRKEKIV
jgi:hypothetical protein